MYEGQILCTGIHFQDTGDGKTKLTVFDRAKTHQGKEALLLLFQTIQFKE